MRALAGFLFLAMICAAGAAFGQDATTDTALQQAILGGWAENLAKCKTDLVTFMPDGQVVLTGDRAATGRFSIKNGAVVAVINGKTETNPVRIVGTGMTILRPSGEVATTMIRCSAAPTPAPAPVATSDAILKQQVLGVWAMSAQKCVTEPVTFSADGTVNLGGERKRSGTFEIRDGSIIATVDGKVQTSRVNVVDGDKLQMLSPNGRIEATIIRCSDPKAGPATASAADAVLVRTLIGTWSEASKCAEKSMTFAEGGRVSVKGDRNGSGTFQVTDGMLSATIDGKVETIRIQLAGSGINLLKPDGQVAVALVRCPEGSKDAAAVPGDSPKLAALRALVTKAVAEQRIFLNCSMSEPKQYELLAGLWKRELDSARAQISADPATVSYLPEFDEATRSDAMLMLNDPFSKVIALCNANPDWARDLAMLNYTLLSLKLKQVLATP